MHVDEHGFEAFQRKAGEAISEHVITECMVHPHPALQSRLSQFSFQLLKTGQTEHEAMKGRQEYGRW